MAGFTTLDSPLARDELAERLFAGQLIVYRGMPAMARLLELSRSRVEAALGADPERAAERFTLAELRERAAGLRRDFEQDEELRAAFSSLFEALGFLPQETFGDRRVVRFVPPGPRREERPLRSLPPHRDTWGSNLPAQINWWAPVYPVAADRTMLLYPGYWDRPIANTTPDWSLDDLFAARARGEAYPQLPVAREMPQDSEALPCEIAPGDLLCFSGAQLHGSAINVSGRMRISLETRTVSLPDLEKRRGAPNVDGHPGVVAYRWFFRASDGRRLDEALNAAGRD